MSLISSPLHSQVAAGLFVLAAVLTWIAVARRAKPLEYASKPAAILFLIFVAASVDPINPWFIGALAFSLLGDVFLMLPDDLFVPGLALFLLAHIAYIVGFVGERLSTEVLLIAVVVMLFVSTALALPIVRSAPRALKAPVIAYTVAISTMAAGAIASAEIPAIAGAGLFLTSDYLIARGRFIRPAGWGPVAMIVTYHLGQAGLVLSLLV